VALIPVSAVRILVSAVVAGRAVAGVAGSRNSLARPRRPT
jgi:hypothetical protein